MSEAGVNWGDISVLSEAGINFGDLTVLSESGINYDDLVGIPMPDEERRNLLYVLHKRREIDDFEIQNQICFQQPILFHPCVDDVVWVRVWRSTVNGSSGAAAAK